MMSSRRRGPPKHQNKYAWKPNAGRKINETEVGGKFRPLSEISGVCSRCKEQIDWKRRYGKYKPLVEPAKCQRCSKRAVRQAYHNLCSGCAKEHGVCAKCCCAVDRIVGRDPSDLEAEQKQLEEAIKNSRERDRRTLLRAMNKDKSKGSEKNPTDNKDKVGRLFPNASLDDYAKQNRHGGHHGGDGGGGCGDNDDGSENEDCDDEDENGGNEECDDDDSDNNYCKGSNEDDDNHEDNARSK